MAITIKKVSGRKELKKFIRFNFKMYKGNPYSVPDLYDALLCDADQRALSDCWGQRWRHVGHPQFPRHGGHHAGWYDLVLRS